jgi:dTDP-4-amino-4,6-dideoxygalactose transaminase
MEPKYHHALVGGNFRMDALQAAILRVKAPHLAGWTDRRRENAKHYAAMFRDAGLIDYVTLPVQPRERRHIFNQFVIRAARRDELRAHLTACGIGTEVYYPAPLHLQPCFGHLGYRRGQFPEAERAASESLALPIYSELTQAQQQAVVSAIAEFVTTTETASLRGSANM